MSLAHIPINPVDAKTCAADFNVTYNLFVSHRCCE
jgi:hypothetical protein